ncbi:MAG TPA: porin, partial [Burkholderiaceae bacterium]|nr:porin [Burkholderiaceae bacterium]
AGPIGAGVSYETLKGFASGNTYGKNLVVGASWDFGFAKILGGYNDVKDVEDPAKGATRILKDQKAGSIGTAIPLGAFNILANYTETKYTLATGLEPKFYKFGITGEYALSKRTFVYTQFDTKGGDFKDFITISDVNGGTGKENFSVGMRTAF